MDDDEINHSPGLAAHPAMDPYEGMPWSSNRQNCQDRNVRLLFKYIADDRRLDRIAISTLGCIV